MTAPLDPATPALSVQYGDFIIDQSNGCLLFSEYDAQDTSTDGTFYIEFRVRLLTQTNDAAADDETFGNLIAAVESDESGLRVPRQKLTVKLGTKVIREWDYAGTPQTAILIQPELRLIEENRRDCRYGFRVRCQFPGNVPNNVRRRESLTRIGAGLREHRVVAFTATWTSGDGHSAYENYVAAGTGFFDDYLPAGVVDQYGLPGEWILASQVPTQNDEKSLCTVEAVFWEVFGGGRRDSAPLEARTITGLRAFTIPSIWCQTNGATALENYVDGGNNYAGQVLPDPVEDGEWVLVDERFAYVDTNGTLQATQVWQECVNGLRERDVSVTADASGIRTVVIAGSFYETASGSARENYDDAINDLVHEVMQGEGITKFESTSVPKRTVFSITKRTFSFVWTLRELAYPEGPEGDDDEDVNFEVLDVEVEKPFGPMSISDENPVQRLRVGTARFTANIAIDPEGDNDPVSLWKDKFRDHTRNAIITRLGDDVSSVEIFDERVGAGLDRNVLTGTLRFLVLGGSILSCQILQRVTQVPGRDFAPRADGTPFSVRAYRAPPEKLLHREITVEYVSSLGTPTFFAAGDVNVSGFGLIDTQKTAQESVDDQNSDDELELNEWFIDRRVGEPYVSIDIPTSRGDDDDFETVVHRQIENWRFVQVLESGTELE